MNVEPTIKKEPQWEGYEELDGNHGSDENNELERIEPSEPTIVDCVIKEEIDVPDNEERIDFETCMIKEEPIEFEVEVSVHEDEPEEGDDKSYDPLNVPDLKGEYDSDEIEVEHISSGEPGASSKRCNLCEHYEIRLASMLSHDCVLKENSLECYICESISKTTNKFKTHVMRNHDYVFGDVVRYGKRLQFNCSFCFKSFSSSFKLRVHEFIHNLVKSFICSLCNKTFTKKKLWRMHQYSHAHSHSQPKAESAYSSIILNYCDNESANKECTEPSEPGETVETVETVESNECVICNIKFNDEKEYTDHKKTHTPHECDICNKSFKRACTLKYHKSYAHGWKKAYRCETCGFINSHLGSVKQHIKAKHSVNLRPHYN